MNKWITVTRTQYKGEPYKWPINTAAILDFWECGEMYEPANSFIELLNGRKYLVTETIDEIAELISGANELKENSDVIRFTISVDALHPSVRDMYFKSWSPNTVDVELRKNESMAKVIFDIPSPMRKQYTDCGKGVFYTSVINIKAANPCTSSPTTEP